MAAAERQAHYRAAHMADALWAVCDLDLSRLRLDPSRDFKRL